MSTIKSLELPDPRYTTDKGIRKYDKAKAEEWVTAGKIPPPPDFSAPTHNVYRPLLEEVVKLADQRDLAGLRRKQQEIEPKSSSRIAICDHVDRCIRAIERAGPPPARHPPAIVLREEPGMKLNEQPTNLILYGPPGTGKTYATISEAVALCDRSPLNYETRQALMSRYNALREAGRIAFVTFHQSYSYEDFVEGLRPETGPEEDGSEVSVGGFRLKPTAGIFKRIATLAEQATISQPNAINLNVKDRNFFKMSLGRAYEDSEIYKGAIDGNYIALGWGGEIDWSDPAYEKRDAILSKWRTIKPDISANAGDVSQTFRLRATMREGDIVIISDGNSLFRAIGEIVGPYEYVADADEYPHRRKVRWLRVLEKSLPVDTILDGKFTQMALYLIDPTKVKRAALETILGADPKSQGGELARQQRRDHPSRCGCWPPSKCW